MRISARRLLEIKLQKSISSVRPFPPLDPPFQISSIQRFSFYLLAPAPTPSAKPSAVSLAKARLPPLPLSPRIIPSQSAPPPPSTPAQPHPATRKAPDPPSCTRLSKVVRARSPETRQPRLRPRRCAIRCRSSKRSISRQHPHFLLETAIELSKQQPRGKTTHLRRTPQSLRSYFVGKDMADVRYRELLPTQIPTYYHSLRCGNACNARNPTHPFPHEIHPAPHRRLVRRRAVSQRGLPAIFPSFCYV